MNSPVLLYVEDNLDDRVLFTKACERANAPFRLCTAEHGQGAIDYLSGSGAYADRTEYPLPHGVLLDIKMPLMDGFGVLRWIRASARFADLPVVMFTSSYQHADIQSAYAQKATAFLTKPSEFKALIQLAAALYACFGSEKVQVEPLKSLPQFMRP